MKKGEMEELLISWQETVKFAQRLN